MWMWVRYEAYTSLVFHFTNWFLNGGKTINDLLLSKRGQLIGSSNKKKTKSDFIGNITLTVPRHIVKRELVFIMLLLSLISNIWKSLWLYTMMYLHYDFFIAVYPYVALRTATSIKYGTDKNGPQRIDHDYFGDSLNFLSCHHEVYICDLKWNTLTTIVFVSHPRVKISTCPLIWFMTKYLQSQSAQFNLYAN